MAIHSEEDEEPVPLKGMGKEQNLRLGTRKNLLKDGKLTVHDAPGAWGAVALRHRG